MKDNSTIIAARNLLHHKIDFLAANETIDSKIEFLLILFLKDHFIEISFNNERLETTFFYDQEKETTATLAISPIKLYAQLLEYIYEMYYGSSSAKDMIAQKEIMAK